MSILKKECLNKVVTFSQGIQVGVDKQYSECNSDRIRFLRIVDYTQNTEDIRYIDKVDDKYIVNEDDIIMVRYGATSGFVGKGIYGVLANNMFKINPSETILKAYLYYYLSQADVQNYLKNKATSSAMPAINFSMFNNLYIPIFDIKTQKKIVEVLDKAQELIDKRKEQIEVLDELVKSRFIEVFGNPLTNTKVFEKVKIKELIDTKIEKSKKVFNDEDEISYIDISCIDNISNKIIDNNKYNFSEAPSRAQQCIKVGDILISTVRPNLKNIAMVRDELENMVTTSGVTVLRSKNINRSFLFRYVLTDYFTEDMVSLTSGANYPAIKSSDIYNHEIIYPPIELQNQFADLVKQVDKLKFDMENSLKELEDNFDSLMQKAFKGKLFN